MKILFFLLAIFAVSAYGLKRAEGAAYNAACVGCGVSLALLLAVQI